MKKILKTTEKFQFGIDFQQAILNFIIRDKDGYRAIEFVDDSYFVLITHAVICKAILGFWKAKKRIPSKPLLNEKLRLLYERGDLKMIRDTDKKEIAQIVDIIYNDAPKDSDEILQAIITFARYINVRHYIENQDLDDFGSYDSFAKQIQKAINIGSEVNDDLGIALVAGAKDRVYTRKLGYEVIPLPYWQLNKALNAGGVEKGSIIMIMARQKRFKTGMLVNWGRYNLSRKKIGFYVDLENGAMMIATREDQSILKANKKEVVGGLVDDKLLKVYRKYSRLKSELYIKRFPGGNRTTINHIQAWLDKLRLQLGIVFDYGIIDYPDVMGASTGRQEDDKRISDIYVDLKNLANDNNLDYILTASHTKNDKETKKRAATKYQGEDVAKCTDKVRHCDMVLGLQENDTEKENGVIRLEIIDQRDGVNDARVYLWADIDKQYVKEFTKEEVKEIYAQLGYKDDGTKKTAKKDSDI